MLEPEGSALPPVVAAPSGWHRFSTAAPSGADLPDDVAVYGPDTPSEATLRLLGTLEGKRVLDLGCGAGRAAVAFARQGAKVIAVDPSAGQLDAARQAAEQAEVRIELEQANPADLAFIRADAIELEQANPADLAFIRADAIDMAFSAFALTEVADLDRVFRQVHRVLKPECPLVFSLPHPAFTMFDPTAKDPLRLRRRYSDRTPHTWHRGEQEVVDHPRTIADTFTSLTRANFRVDAIVEPAAGSDGPRGPQWADLMAAVPATVVFRARKQGI